jgi:hypothetical protein
MPAHATSIDWDPLTLGQRTQAHSLRYSPSTTSPSDCDSDSASHLFSPFQAASPFSTTMRSTSCFKPNQPLHAMQQGHPSRPPTCSRATQEACTASAAGTPGKQALPQLYAASSSGPGRTIRAVAAPPPAQLLCQRLLPILCRTYIPCNPVDDLTVIPLFTYSTRTGSLGSMIIMPPRSTVAYSHSHSRIHLVREGQRGN